MAANNKKEKNLKWKVSDILGFEVFDQDGSSLGVLSNVFGTGNNDVWSIKSQEEEILIPALKTIVSKVDIANKKIFVCLPEGYSDVYGTKIKLEDAVEILEEYNGFVVYED